MTTLLGLHGLMVCLLITMACVCLVVAEVSGASEAGPHDQPEEIRRGMPMRPDGKSRTQLFFERIAKGVEPSLKGSPERLAMYLDQFRAHALNDARLVAFDAHADWDADRGVVVLSGHVEYVEHRKALTAYLQVLGFDEIDDRTDLMPTADLGDQPFGIVSAEKAFLYASPDDRSETVTQTRTGEPVFLLKPAAGGYFYCHVWDGYVGYVRGSEIERAGPERLAEAIPSPADGAADQAIEAGSKLRGTPYVWAGTTAAGIDCSGLTRLAYRQLGVLLPRDSDQQAMLGRLTATRGHRENMRRGDLMFFLGSRGKINHTAIYLGGGRFLESGGPGVRIVSLDPDDPDYIEKRDRGFAFAKRVLE